MFGILLCSKQGCIDEQVFREPNGLAGDPGGPDIQRLHPMS